MFPCLSPAVQAAEPAICPANPHSTMAPLHARLRHRLVWRSCRPARAQPRADAPGPLPDPDAATCCPATSLLAGLRPSLSQQAEGRGRPVDRRPGRARRRRLELRARGADVHRGHRRHLRPRRRTHAALAAGAGGRQRHLPRRRLARRHRFHRARRDSAARRTTRSALARPADPPRDGALPPA